MSNSRWKLITLSDALAHPKFNGFGPEFCAMKNMVEIFFENLDIKLEEAFKILGLNSDSDLKAVKTKYKNLAKKWHPDVQNDSKSKINKDKFINITNAYKIILESNERIYDEFK